MPHCGAMRPFLHLATRPPGQRVSRRRLSCRSQRPTRRAGNAGSAECLPDLWCDVLRVAFGATAGQRQIIFTAAWLAVPDLPSEMAADQTPLARRRPYVEITLLFSSLKAD